MPLKMGAIPLIRPIWRGRRDHGVVVRPDRSVVIGHWVVARLRAGDRADAPAGIRMRDALCRLPRFAPVPAT